MQNKYILIAATTMTLFSSIGSASVQNFWAHGSSDSVSKNSFLSNIGDKSDVKNISINYSIQSDWTVNSAKLWIKAVDDYNNGGGCGKRCEDSNKNGRDRSEMVKITKIEGSKQNINTKEINGQAWYELIDVTSWLLNDKNNKFTASLKSTRGGDFWFKNARLEVDYDIKTAAIDPIPAIDPAPAAVPVPAAIWLFGSALAGLIRMNRKS